MMSLMIIIVVLIIASSFWYILSPLTARDLTQDDFCQDHRIESLESKKSEILLTLKDLKADHFSQKISDEDYQRFYQETIAEGTQVLKQIEKINAQEDLELESKEQSMEVKYCIECGKDLLIGAKFCAYCGKKIVIK